MVKLSEMQPVFASESELWGNSLVADVARPNAMPHMKVLLPVAGPLSDDAKEAIRQADSSGVECEGVWVFVVKADESRAMAILDNTPLFCVWVGLRDVVEVEELNPDHKPYITRVIA